MVLSFGKKAQDYPKPYKVLQRETLKQQLTEKMVKRMFTFFHIEYKVLKRDKNSPNSRLIINTKLTILTIKTEQL